MNLVAEWMKKASLNLDYTDRRPDENAFECIFPCARGDKKRNSEVLSE